MSALVRLLSKFCGLRTLVVSAVWEIVLSPEVIVKHAATLRKLYIDSAVSHGQGPGFQWYRDICSVCTQFEQMALPAPFVRLRRLIPDSSSAKQMDSEPLWHSETWLFREVLNELLRLPKLVTLRILDVDCEQEPRECTCTEVMEAAHRVATFLSRTFKAWS